MIGLIILIVGVIYLAVLVVVTRAAYRWAKSKGLSKTKCRLAAAGGFLTLYLPVFWDHIPTVVMHQYYCAKDSGFWIYKTLDQWKTENPGVAERLVANKGAPSRGETFDDGYGKTSTYLLNDRFNWIVTQHDISGLLPIIRTEQQVTDVQKNEVLARYVDFGAGNSVKNTVGPPGPLKFWLHNGRCIGGERNGSLMRQFKNHFRGAEK